LSKPQSKSAKHALPQRATRAPVNLKKEEVQRLGELRTKMIASRAKDRPDVESTLELMYLRILGRVKNRGPAAANLKQLKSLLDQAAAMMVKIMDESEGSSGSKK
jgi:hypothetical protein